MRGAIRRAAVTRSRSICTGPRARSTRRRSNCSRRSAPRSPATKLHDVVKPAVGERGTLALGFDAQRGYHGKLRAELVKTGEVHALACVWNQREPKVCEAACAKWFGGGS